MPPAIDPQVLVNNLLASVNKLVESDEMKSFIRTDPLAMRMLTDGIRMLQSELDDIQERYDDLFADKSDDTETEDEDLDDEEDDEDEEDEDEEDDE